MEFYMDEHSRNLKEQRFSPRNMSKKFSTKTVFCLFDCIKTAIGAPKALGISFKKQVSTDLLKMKDFLGGVYSVL